MSSSFSGFPTGGLSWDKVQAAFGSSRTTHIENDLKAHLGKVYMSIAGACFAAALGVMFYMKTHFSNSLLIFASFGLMAFFVALDKREVTKRTGIFGLFSFIQGVQIGNLVEVSLYVDPSLVLFALGITFALFCGFSAAALTSNKRSQLYLGGLLYSGMWWLSMAGLANIFFHSQVLFNLNLYGGLLIFAGYIMFDTQLIILKYEMGERDHLSHSLELFLDVISIFTRVLIILLKNNEDKNRRNTRRRNE